MKQDGRIVGAAGGAVGLSGVAAFLGTCCVAPWAVTLFGVSGAVMLARLAFLQPYILLGAALALGLAFWWAYRPPLPRSDAVCDPAANRRVRRWVWIAAMAMAILAVLSLLPLFVDLT